MKILKKIMQGIIKLFFLTIPVLFILSCAYHLDNPQGNELKQEDLNNLSIGMTKSEVGQVIGYPLLDDLFHHDRWDYIAIYRPGYSKDVFESKVTLYFENDLLVSIDDADYTEILSSEDEKAKKRMVR